MDIQEQRKLLCVPGTVSRSLGDYKLDSWHLSVFKPAVNRALDIALSMANTNRTSAQRVTFTQREVDVAKMQLMNELLVAADSPACDLRSDYRLERRVDGEYGVQIKFRNGKDPITTTLNVEFVLKKQSEVCIIKLEQIKITVVTTNA